MKNEFTEHEIPPEPKVLPPRGWKQNRKLILASASDRRRALLQSMGLQFSVTVSGVDEEGVAAENARQLTQKLAKMKTEAVVPKSGEATIIGADSLVEFEGRQIGKPKTIEEARRFFQRFSGREQDVYTGICVLCANPRRANHGRAISGRAISGSMHSVVEFNPLSNEQIESWLHEGNPLDLAGGYYIYEIIRRGFIKRITPAQPDNVAGLPRAWLKEALSKLGFYDG